MGVIGLFIVVYIIEKYTNTFGIAHKIWWKLVDLINAVISALKKYANS